MVSRWEVLQGQQRLADSWQGIRKRGRGSCVSAIIFMILTLLLEAKDWLAHNYTKEDCQSQKLTEIGLWQSASRALLLFSAKEGLISFENVLSKRKKKKTERKWHNRFQCNIYCVGELVQIAVVQHLDSRKFELIFTVVCFYSWEIECKSCMAGTKVSILHLAQSLTFTLTSAYSHVRQITSREKKKRKGKIKYLPYFLSSVKFVLAGHTVVFHYIQPIDSLLLSFL